jgi:hypothetical protein
MGMERSKRDSISPTLGEAEVLEEVAVAASAAAEGKNEANVVRGLLEREKKVDKGEEGDAAEEADTAGTLLLPPIVAAVFTVRVLLLPLLLLFSPQVPLRNETGSLEVGLEQSAGARVLLPPRDECRRPGCCCCLNA